ncbi:permease prefix domain 1-containing protein [Clostridium estertheticum]|uniref:permease prefix domain 1-containing protein n=1 Tax=Clostridium estertheticum TaxID=238834 RepID=UPI0013EEBC60|nr:permease prefix domain 1-containing protein [Clostridium estertheticum]MBZ9606551.1 permease prefix domain 1-containing protein [Clostridium estertheticum]
METIKNYLDNMFKVLPRTNQTMKLKNDLLWNMEEKYNENKNDGKSENEAIGIVISEFGNIDELIDELGIEHMKKGAILKTITQEEADNFMTTKKESGLLMGIGVFLCIIATAILILITTLIDGGIICKGISKDFSDMFGIIALFLLCVPAVALFIYSGMKLEKYKYLKSGFDLPLHAKAIINQKNNAFASTYMISIITGVCICVISPVALFVSSAFGDNASSYGVVVLLVMVAIAAFIFIYFGNIKQSFSILLQIGDFSKEETEDNKLIGAVAAIVWPLAICIFLVSGLVFNLWHINWIIFPIIGILFGMFSAAYSIIKGHN